MQELTLTAVGIDFPNADGSNRRSEAMMTLPGEPVELVPEPKNKHDSNAIAVISPRGVQIGYLSAERAPYIGGRMSRGEDAVVIFQGMDGGSAFVRVRFGGGAPTLPPASSASTSPSRCLNQRHDPDGFYPDDEGPDWGA
ncbi:MAG: hypothetical protein EON55_27115 [Alphaproteobacteria bacterium]|nr:MAG: hypothetical protein EON55_27115 [Alphaproteobacteria bacterium]